MDRFKKSYEFKVEVCGARSKKLLAYIEKRDKEILRLNDLIRYLEIVYEED